MSTVMIDSSPLSSSSPSASAAAVTITTPRRTSVKRRIQPEFITDSPSAAAAAAATAAATATATATATHLTSTSAAAASRAPLTANDLFRSNMNGAQDYIGDSGAVKRRRVDCQVSIDADKAIELTADDLGCAPTKLLGSPDIEERKEVPDVAPTSMFPALPFNFLPAARSAAAVTFIAPSPQEHKETSVNPVAQSSTIFRGNARRDPAPYAAAPTETDRLRSHRIMLDRMERCLANAEQIGVTTAKQRDKMSKAALVQRNLEIALEQMYLDTQYAIVLDCMSADWQMTMTVLDERMDTLSEESDEIETLLLEKFNVVGGGRPLIGDEMLEASSIGGQFAQNHKKLGLPTPKLTASVAIEQLCEEKKDDAAVQHTIFNNATIAAPSCAPTSDAHHNAHGTSNIAFDAGESPAKRQQLESRLKLAASKSKSDAAVAARLDVEVDAIRSRRAEREGKAKDSSLLHHYMEYFEQFVDVDRAVKQSDTTRPAATKRAQSFPFYLGTISFPLYRRGIERDVETVHVKKEAENNMASDETSAIPAMTITAMSPAVIDSTGASVAPIGDIDEQNGDDAAAAQQVVLDFTRDERYHDGCIVRSLRRTQSREENDADGKHEASTDEGAAQGAIIGLLPLDDLHPVSSSPELQYDELGELLPVKRKQAQPEPSHPLAAIFILQAADIIKLSDAVLIPASKDEEYKDGDDDNDDDMASGERIEVAIHVNSRIFNNHLLRSTAQRESLQTLFSLFAPSMPEVAAPAVLSDQAGDETKNTDVAAMDIDSTVDVVDCVGDATSPASLNASSGGKHSPAAASNFTDVVDEGITHESDGGDEEDDDVEMDDVDEDDEDDSEDEDEFDGDDGDELLQTFQDRVGFVDLFLPSDDADGDLDDAKDDENDIDIAELEKRNIEQETGAVHDNAMSAEEVAALRQVARDAAGDGDGDADIDNKAETDEDQQLAREQHTQWHINYLNSLFESIRPTPAWQAEAQQPRELLSTLYPYQKKALAWMIARETTLANRGYQDPLWQAVQLNGLRCFFNVTSGRLTKQTPSLIHDIRGGIVAEEVGLGKSVEVIALILARPWTSPSSSIASASTAATTTMTDRFVTFQQAGIPWFTSVYSASPKRKPIKATLIVCPMSLLYQWANEIRKHSGETLNVLVYDGVKQQRDSSSAYDAHVSMMDAFSKADVVLTTYYTLGCEVNYSKRCSYGFRSKKQYHIPRSPLVDCHYHRIILDEAQQVHTVSGVFFRMAARISADCRWAVSGTPIGPNGLNDLFGLVSYLGVEPFDRSAIWNHAMRSSTEKGLARLQSLLKRIMWRHNKSHVSNEISLPRLHNHTIVMNFNAIEYEYYRRLEQECQGRVLMSGMRGELEDRSAFTKLESLRQACAHPQASSATFLGTNFLNQKQIGERMIKRVLDESTTCERELARAYVTLGLELLHQQEDDEQAEEMLVRAWRIADSGVTTDGGTALTCAKEHIITAAKERSANQLTNAIESATPAAAEMFESTLNIVTANPQIARWRKIELVLSFHLANLYAKQLKTKFNLVVPEITNHPESFEVIFQRELAKAQSQADLAREANISLETAAAQPVITAAQALPPALIRDAADNDMNGILNNITVIAEDGSEESMKPANILLRKYIKQREQYHFALHDLLDLFEMRLAELAVQIVISYENDLLPKFISNSTSEVKDLCAKRLIMGIDTFNSVTNQGEVNTLLETIESKKELVEIILNLYDLSRTKYQIESFSRQLSNVHSHMVGSSSSVSASSQASDPLRVIKCKLAVHEELLRLKFRRYYNSRVIPVSQASSFLSEFQRRLARQLSGVQGAITKMWKRLPNDVQEQLKIEQDLNNVEPETRKYHRKYDADWHSLRDSRHVLLILKEIRLQRARMRLYIHKMQSFKAGILRECNLLADDYDEQEQRLTLNDLADEQRRLAMDEDELKANNNKTSPKKRQASPNKREREQQRSNSHEQDRNDGDDDEKSNEHDNNNGASSSSPNDAAAATFEDSDMVAADIPSGAAAASSAPRPASGSSSVAATRSNLGSSSLANEFDSEAALSIDAVKEARIRSLRADVDRLKIQAVMKQRAVTFLRAKFGQAIATDTTALSNEICAICLQSITIPALTTCGHYFDEHCLSTWMKKQRGACSCPTCKRPLTNEDFCLITQIPHPVKYDANATVAATVPIKTEANTAMNDDSDEKSRESTASSSVGSATAAPSSAPSYNNDIGANIPSVEELQHIPLSSASVYGSKIEAMIRYIRWLIDRDRLTKCLVFSQYYRMLQMVARSLADNRINHLLLSGSPRERAKLIDRFQGDPHCNVFLLSLRTDNSGLTLVSATSVFLMEPSLDPSIEAQAINRIHRIGQTRETHSFRFIMRNSVEQTIDQMLSQSKTQKPEEKLVRRSKESMSVNQLLRILQLTDEQNDTTTTTATTNHTAAAPSTPQRRISSTSSNASAVPPSSPAAAVSAQR